MARKRDGFLHGDERMLSIVVFGLYFSWVMAIPYEGQILHALGQLHQYNIFSLMYTCIFAHFIGLLSCGFLCKSIRTAKKLMSAGILFSMAATGILVFSPSFLWQIAVVAASLFAGIGVAAWSFFYKNGSSPKMRLKTAADSLILSNVLMIFLNIATIYISPYVALGMCMLMLMGSFWLARKLPEKEHERKTEEQAVASASLRKPLAFLCLFVLLSTIDGGLMFQVVTPTYSHLTSLSSWYWTLPYVGALIVVRNLQKYSNGVYYLYVAIAMAGMAFLAFWILPVNWFSYLVVDTLLMGASGIFNIFWWSILGTMITFCNKPARVFGCGLAANVLGVLIGSVFGYFANTGSFPQSSVVMLALMVIFVILVLLPPLHGQLSKVLGSHGFLSGAQQISEQTSASTSTIPRFETLSSREHEVALLLLKGQPYRIIAEQLHISENTVKTYVKNIYSKLEVQSRTELIQLGLKQQDK